MAQRTVMRMSLAQMRAMGDDTQPQPAGSTAGPDDTIYFVTFDTTQPNNPEKPYVWGIAFGPSRSRDHAFQIMARTFPRIQPWMRQLGNFNNGVEWDENNHFRWEEPNGDKCLLRLEQLRSAAVRASNAEEVFFVVRMVRPSGNDEEEGAHESNIVGVFLNDSEATAFAVRSLREACEGQTIMKLWEGRRPDSGLMMCMAESSGPRGRLYGFDVGRNPWCNGP